MNDISVTFFADSGKQHQFCWEIKIVSSVKNIANKKSKLMLKFIWGDMNSQKYGSIGAWYIQYKSTQNLQVAKAINNIYHFAIYV